MNEEQQDEKSLYYFENAPIPKAIMYMAVPMMIGMSINMLYNIIDAYFIGRLHNTAMMSAVTLALPVSTILMALGNVFGTGGGTYISRLMGEKNLDNAKIVSSVTFYFSMLAGIIFMFLAIPTIEPLVGLLGAKGETFIYTKQYVMIFLIGGPFVIANFALEQVVRAEGASTVSMNGMFISVIVNTILDPIFIFVCHLGVSGAAIGTIIGNMCAVLYYFYYLEKKSAFLSLSIKKCKPTGEILNNIFKIGISAFFLDSFLIVSCLLLNNFSAYYGDFAVAGFGISQRVVQLSEFVGMGLGMGVVPLIAYGYTAKNIHRMKQVINTTAVYMGIVIFTFSFLLFIFRAQIVQLFSTDAHVIKTGSYILTAMLISSLFAGFSGLFINIFQGVGREKESVIMSVAQGIILIPVMILGNYIFGLHGVIWSMTVAEILTFIIGLVLWIHFNQDDSMKVMTGNIFQYTKTKKQVQ